MASIAFMALGSMGDMNPLLGVAQEMQERGHRVTFIATPYYEDVVRSAGLAFYPIGSKELFAGQIATASLWSPLRFIQTSFSAALTYVDDSYAAIRALHSRGLDAVAIQCQCFGAQIAAEGLGIPIATMATYPVLLQTAHDPVHYPLLEPLAKAGRLGARLQYKLVNRIFEHTIRGGLNDFRRRIGLPPVYDHATWMWQTQRHVALWPEFMRGAHADCYLQLRHTGFIDFDGQPADTAAVLDEEFLEREPIVFTLGTVMLFGSKFFAAAAEAMAAMPERCAYFVTRYPDQLPRELPPNVKHLSFFPFASLLPRCSAIVHHGGIGTSARALAAAIPQIIVPFAFDQVDNAHLLGRLGVATRLMPKEISGKTLRTSLSKLLESPHVRAACAEYSGQIDGRAAVERACLILEDMLAEHQALRPEAMPMQDALPVAAQSAQRRARMIYAQRPAYRRREAAHGRTRRSLPPPTNEHSQASQRDA